MKTFLCTFCLASILHMSSEALAQRIEISAAISPVFAMDQEVQSLTSTRSVEPRIGGDLRVLVGAVAGFEALPLLSYRYFFTEGELGPVSTELSGHDLTLGVRIRRSLNPFLSFFAQAEGGLALSAMHASLSESSSSRSSSQDHDASWAAGGSVGLCVGPSHEYFERRGIRRFSFSGELSGGYLVRGETTVQPKLDDGDEYSLKSTRPASWGTLDTSGWFAQVAFGVRFL